MRLHFVKIDPSGKTYSDIIAKVTDSNLGLFLSMTIAQPKTE